MLHAAVQAFVAADEADTLVAAGFQGIEDLLRGKPDIGEDAVEVVALRVEIGEDDVAGMLPQPGDFMIGMFADDDDSGGAFEQRSLRQVVGMEDLHDLRLEVAAARFDAEAHADIIGIGDLVRRLQEMHDNELGEQARRDRAVRLVAVARCLVVERLGRLDDRLPLDGRNRQSRVVIQNARDRSGGDSDGLGDFLDRHHPDIPFLARRNMARIWENRNRFQ